MVRKMLDWRKIYRLIANGNSRTVKVKKNIVVSCVLKGCSILISLLLVPLTLGYLNKTEYGIWLTMSSVLTWINLFDIGLGNGLRNKLAQALAEGDKKRGQVYVSTTVALLCMIMGGVFLLFLVVNHWLDWNAILNVTTLAPDELSRIVMVVITFFCLQFIFKFVGIILLADQKSALNDLLWVVSSLLSLVIIFLLTRFTTGHLSYVALTFSAAPVVVMLIACLVIFRGRYRFLTPRVSCVQFRYSRVLMGVGVQFLILQISGIVVFYTSNLLISQMFGPQEVTPYNIAFRYFNVVTMLFNIVLTPLWSAYTHAYYSGDFAWIRKMTKSMVGCWGLSLLLVAVMILCADYVYKFWVGPEVYVSADLTYMMAAYVVIANWNNIFAQMLAGVGKIRLSLINSVFNAVVYIPLALYCGKHFGIAGILVAMCGVLLTSSFWQPVQCWKIINQTAKGLWNC